MLYVSRCASHNVVFETAQSCPVTSEPPPFFDPVEVMCSIFGVQDAASPDVR